jgi:hypothetical protein
MSDNNINCDLCGLLVDDKMRYCLNFNKSKLVFCCDACLGIYKLLNDIDEEQEQLLDQKAPSDKFHSSN